MDVFEEYLEGIVDEAHRTRMREVLDWVSTTYPMLTKRFAWNQPMFTDHGTFIIGFSVSKAHLAAAPEGIVVERFSDEIKRAGYDHTAKFIRFPWNKPMGFDLLGTLIDFNRADKAECTTFWRP